MKKLLLAIVAVCSFALYSKAQNVVSVYGSIDTAISGKKVWVGFSGGPGSGCFFIDSTVTTSSGDYYFPSLNLGACSYGSIWVSTIGCRNYYDTLTQHDFFDSTKNYDTLWLNFKYCDTGCSRFYTSVYSGANPFTKEISVDANTNGNKFYWNLPGGSKYNGLGTTFSVPSAGLYNMSFVSRDTLKGCYDSIPVSRYLMAYDSVFVKGQIDTPINNHSVLVSQYTSWYGWWHTETFYTNSSGQYSGWFKVLDSTGKINASILNCRNDSIVNDNPHFNYRDTVIIDFVYCPPYNPCAGFSINFSSYTSGTTANFYPYGSTTATAFYWSFGDGGSSTTKYPTHNYAAVDSVYNVCVIASDTVRGCMDTICKNVHIDPRSFLAGYVDLDSTSSQIDSGFCRVWLIKKDSVGSDVLLTAIDSINLSDSGYYTFRVMPGNYLVKAALLPSSTFYNDYLPTYHTKASLWSSATNVSITTSPYTLANITLIKGSNPGGSGFIGGFVSVGANKTGDPVEKADVLLFTAAGNPVAFVKTDGGGQYAFNNLAFGSYKVRIEVVGKPSEEYLVTLDANNPSAANGNFEVNSKDIKLKKSGTGILETTAVALGIYPNPASNNVSVSFENAAAGSAIITISDLAGKVVKTVAYPATQGNNILSIDLDGLKNGLYIIGVNTAHAQYTGRVSVSK